MKLDRKSIVLAILSVLLVITIGCGKKPPPPAPPAPPAPPPPATDVVPPPKPAPAADVEEKMPEPSVQELQAEYERQGLLGDVFFDFDQYDLRSDARERLAKNAEFMKSSQGRALTFLIEGHCDERGTNEYNIALGQRRGSTALDFLISQGIDRSRFRTVSYGEERPFCTESSEGCWQKNRRARFVITGTGG